MLGNNFLLWENDVFVIKTPFNPHTPYSEGPHLIVTTKIPFESAWSDVDVSAEAFRISAEACKIMEAIHIAPWFNIQANGNWGLLPGGQKFFHIHIYGRNRTAHWGQPITLPKLPETYNHEPMPESDRSALIKAFQQLN